MTLASFLAYVGVAALVICTPGPDTALTIRNTLFGGRAGGVLTALGVATGLSIWALATSLGLVALLVASEPVFRAIQYAGAAYLIYLGVKLFRAGGTLDATPRTDATPPLKMMAHAWLVTALNPKSITFFVAFLPQFIDRNADFLTQMIVFETTFLTLAFANAFGYALVASRAGRLVRSPRAIRIFNRTGGTLLVGAGVATAVARSGN